ncbi:MFS general substrate transporter, partial [Aureobasidium melanogenum]
MARINLVPVLSGLWIGTLFVALDETMIATIAVPITTSLASLSSFSWVSTTYLTGSIVSQAISGHLVDFFGRIPGLMVCFALFTTGTVLCGLAPTLPFFLLGRSLQGIGGGAICSITSVLETDIIPVHRRAFVEGLANPFYGVVLALGGVYGAFVTRLLSWRWAFLLQVPVIIIDGIAIFRIADVPDKRVPGFSYHELDLVGISSLLATIVLSEYGLNLASTNTGWRSPHVTISLSISVICLAIFIYWETSRAKRPVVPVNALLERSVGAIQISAFLSTGCLASVFFYIPIYLDVHGLTDTAKSLRFIPLALLFGLAGVVIGHIVQRTNRYYHTNLSLQLTSAVAYALLCTLHQNSQSWEPFFYLGILGFGVGGSYVTNLLGILTCVSETNLTTVQSASWSVRSAGVAFGLITSSFIFQSVARVSLSMTGHQALIGDHSNQDFADLPELSNVPEKYKEAYIKSHDRGTHAVFLALLAQAAIGTVVCLFIQDKLIEQNDYSSQDHQIQELSLLNDSCDIEFELQVSGS